MHNHGHDRRWIRVGPHGSSTLVNAVTGVVLENPIRGTPMFTSARLTFPMDFGSVIRLVQASEELGGRLLDLAGHTRSGLRVENPISLPSFMVEVLKTRSLGGPRMSSFSQLENHNLLSGASR